MPPVLGNSCVKIKKTMSGPGIITSRAGGTPLIEDDLVSGLEGCIAVHLADMERGRLQRKNVSAEKNVSVDVKRAIGVPSGGA